MLRAPGIEAADSARPLAPCGIFNPFRTPHPLPVPALSSEIWGHHTNFFFFDQLFFISKIK